MARLSKKTHLVVVEGGLNPLYFDYFWAYQKLHFMSESEMIRDNWRKLWDSLPDAEKNVIKKWLEKNPSPRMEQHNKMKCE